MRSQAALIFKGGIAMFCLAVTTVTQAQESKPTAAPHEPLLPKAPEMAAWTIMYQYPADKRHGGKKDSKNSKDRIVSVEIQKTGEIYHKVTRWENGKQSDVWSVRGREVIKADSDSEYVPTPVSGPVADDFAKSDFEDLDWLDMKHYAGLTKGLHPNFVFRAKHKDRSLTRREKLVLEAFARLHPKSGDGGVQATANPTSEFDPIELADQSPDAEDVVTLDATSQLPVECEQGSSKWTYRFVDPPTSQLEPPAEVNTLLEHWGSFIKSSESAGSPP